MQSRRKARPIIALIVARASNGVIGNNNALPWDLPDDLRHFKRLTVGKPVVMGRRTFESIGRPLPARHNIVLSTNPGWSADGVTVVPNLAEAVAAAGLDPKVRAPEIMIIGGAQIYAQALPLADRIYLTQVHIEPEGDTLFPDLRPGEWRETAREDHPGCDGAPAYSFITLERTGETLL